MARTHQVVERAVRLDFHLRGVEEQNAVPELALDGLTSACCSA